MRFTRGFGDGTIALEGRACSAAPAPFAAALPAPALAASPPAPPQQPARAAPSPRDKTLTALAIRWRDGFPPDARPLALCHRYPRIANRLALCWDDAALTAKVFQDLMVDHRGNRRGFPAEVKRELLFLRDGRANGAWEGSVSVSAVP